MPEVTIVELREQLATWLGKASDAGERVVVTKHGKPIAAVIPYADLRLLQKIEAHMSRLLADAVLSDLKDRAVVELDERQDTTRATGTDG
ncbi:MAG: hypothetical protein BWY76_00575 [bacterium ADurb.Bin429]|nr:MAG: hypothetical protein BWY76_00575 [bacterium ADurb.Bin429]